MFKDRATRERVQATGIYALLLLGAVVFCWPLLWMVFTSVKLDRELFARKMHLLPETPVARAVSPYVDENSFRDLEGDSAADLLPVLEAEIRPQAKTLDPNLDPDVLTQQLARGVYQHMTDTMTDAQWQQPVEALRTLARQAATPVLLGKIMDQIRHSLIIGQLRARSYDLQEDQLISPKNETQVWRMQQGVKAELVPTADGQGAEFRYEYGDNDMVSMEADLQTSFPISRLYRIQLSVRPDESWNRLSAFVEMDGQRLEPVRPQVLSDSNWTVYTWQEEGPDDLTNKIRSWTLLQPAEDVESPVKGAHNIKVILQLQRTTPFGAWIEKFQRNYLMVFDNMPFWRYAATSVLLVLANMVGALISCSMVAYSFSRLQWPGRNLSFAIMLGTMMIPTQVTMIPFFLIVKSLGWFNTLTPLWVMSFTANAFNVFLMHQFFKGIPRDLEDAAKIDGCGPLRSYWYIMLPLVKPTLATVAVFTFMGVWNDFLGPLIYLSDQRLYPLSLGLYALNVQSGGGMAMMMAGSLLMTMPVILVFFFAQRYFIQGITMTGMKG
jgi:multiple sugar transport system permease protein